MHVCVCVCKPVSICVCVIAKENWRVRFSVSKVTAASFSFFFFLRAGGGISDHQRPTFHKFTCSHKKTGHFCVIPCHIAHCLLVITNAQREMERKGESGREERAFFLDADVSYNLWPYRLCL